MANIFDLIDRALQPDDPWKPARALANEIKFKIPAEILKERERVTRVYRDAMARIDELATATGPLIEDERAMARHELESGGGPPFESIKTKADFRRDIRGEIKMIKLGLTDILSEFASECRPVAEKFVAVASSHVDAIAEAERAECKRFGLDYVEGSLVNGLRQSIALVKTAIPTPGALNSPISFLPWLPDSVS